MKLKGIDGDPHKRCAKVKQISIADMFAETIRRVDVIPLYAMSNLCKLSVDTEMK